MTELIQFIEMETGFGIEPMANLAQLPDRVEACGRRQPTEPVLIKMTARVRTENAIQEVYDLGTRLHPHCTFKILHTFNDDVHGAPVANCKL
jgi:hypothetical protein